MEVTQKDLGHVSFAAKFYLYLKIFDKNIYGLS
jgi:hypothetical protein